MKSETSPPANEHAAFTDAFALAKLIRLNVKYYGCRLGKLQRMSLGSEVAVAIATSTTLGSLAIFAPLAPYFAAVAAMMSIIKPILNLEKRIGRVSGLWSSYTILGATADHLLRDIRVHRAFTPAMDAVVSDLRDRVFVLEREDDPDPDQKLKDKCEAETNTEMDSASFWWLPATA